MSERPRIDRHMSNLMEPDQKRFRNVTAGDGALEPLHVTAALGGI
jgi:hypothetical protein